VADAVVVGEYIQAGGVNAEPQQFSDGQVDLVPGLSPNDDAGRSEGPMVRVSSVNCG
jgi:hypothetical protein